MATRKRARPIQSTFRRRLAGMSACPEALDWAKSKTLSEAWRTCPHGDWMAWYLRRTGAGWGVVNDTLSSLWSRAYTFRSSYADAQKRYAELIRERFTPTGKRRTPRGARGKHKV